MLRGLWTLTWLEIKIFLREPLGAVGMILIPVLVFLALSRLGARTTPTAAGDAIGIAAPVLASLLIAVNTVVSLVTIISIYREGGILKRLRATPLRPHTILTAHVIVKLLLTTATFISVVLVSRRGAFTPSGGSPVAFAIALLISTWSILSIGFLIASIVPTARFAQPLAGAVLYPLFAISGLFVPVDAMPPLLRTAAYVSPITHAASLLRGVWSGHAWTAHTGDLLALAAAFVVCTVISSYVFRWE